MFDRKKSKFTTTREKAWRAVGEEGEQGEMNESIIAPEKDIVTTDSFFFIWKTLSL